MSIVKVHIHVNTVRHTQMSEAGLLNVIAFRIYQHTFQYYWAHWINNMSTKL